MKILLATTNKDKEEIVKRILKSTIFKDAIFYNLEDIPPITELEEIGDIINRAKDKALNVYNQLLNNEFDFIVGIDDAIKIKGKVIENVKEYLNKIINENYLEENEIIYMLRAFTLINKLGKEKTILTEIPYEYKSSKEKLTIKKNSYPLNYVLYPINSNESIANLDKEESNNYFVSCIKNNLNELKEIF